MKSAAGVLLVDVGASIAHDQVLLVRSLNRRRWETPGGWIKNGESIEDCAVRELLEETGLQTRVGYLENVDVAIARRFTYTTFVARAWEGDLRLARWEIVQARWVPWRIAFTLISDEHRPRLLHALQHVTPITAHDWGERKTHVERKRRTRT